MDSARGLITKICDEGKINQVQRAGINETFLDEDTKTVFSFITRHYNEYKDTPSRTAVKKVFPNFEFTDYKEPLEYFIDELKDSYRRAVLEEKLSDIGNIYTADISQVENLLRDTLAELQVTSQHFRDIDLAKTALSRVETYEKRKLGPAEDGIKSGWSKMDYQTLGWHPEEFIVLVGEKYMGKSWVLIWLAYQALLQNKKVLFVTNEMSSEAITRRFDAVYSSVRFDALRRGELTNVEEKRYREKMADLAKSTFHFTVAREGIATIQDIETKAVEVDADIIFGDSIYLFLPDNKTQITGETQKRLGVSQACKKVARNLGIPFIVSVQAGRKKTKSKEPDLDDIEWSNAFSQDADTVFFIEKKDLDKELNRLKIHLLKSRDGDMCKFFIDTDFDQMKFGQREDVDEPTTSIQFEDDDEDTIDYD